MPSASMNKFNCLTLDLGKKLHDLSADSFKVMLTNTLPLATNTVKADITQIAGVNGYTTDGSAAAITSYLNAAGVSTWILQDVLWTAVTGAMGPFRYAVLYNATANRLMTWYDYGTSITPDGVSSETFLWDASAANGIFTVT